MNPEGNEVDASVATTGVKIVATQYGGFPIDNIAYWKEIRMLTSEGERPNGLIVAFKSGGYIEMPDVSMEEFQSLVYGEPF